MDNYNVLLLCSLGDIFIPKKRVRGIGMTFWNDE